MAYERKEKYTRQAGDWFKPEENENVEFKVDSSEHFETVWQHWLEAERKSRDCTVTFKWDNEQPNKVPGTCKYCDEFVKTGNRKMQSKPRYFWDVYINGGLTCIAMSTTSHKNLLKFLANIALSGRDVSQETFVLKPRRTEIEIDGRAVSFVALNFDLKGLEVDTPPPDNEPPAPPEAPPAPQDFVLSDLEKEMIKEHSSEIFENGDWKLEGLRDALHTSLLSRNINNKERATQIAEYVLQRGEKILEEI